MRATPGTGDTGQVCGYVASMSDHPSASVRNHHRSANGLDKLVAVLCLGSMFAIGFVLLTGGPGGAYEVGGPGGFLFAGVDALVVAVLALIGSGLVMSGRARAKRRRQILGWVVLAAGCALFAVAGVPTAV